MRGKSFKLVNRNANKNLVHNVTVDGENMMYKDYAKITVCPSEI